MHGERRPNPTRRRTPRNVFSHPLRSDVVPGGEEVTGIQADPHAVLFFHEIDDRAQVFEAVTDCGSLAGGDLQCRAGGECRERLWMTLIESAMRRIPSSSPLPHVCAGVDNETGDAEVLAPVQLVEERGAGAGQHVLLRGAEVDEVGGVGHDRADGGSRRGGTEELDLLTSLGLCLPAAGVLHEHLHGGAADPFAACESGVNAAGDGHV